MTNTNNILKPIILVSITAIISLSVSSVVTWYVMTNNKPDTIIEVKYVENSREESTDLDLSNQMLIEENSFKIKVPTTWKVEKIECPYNPTCVTLEISKNNYYLRVNTDVTITGGGVPGNPYGGIFSKFEVQTNSLNTSFSRTDYTYDGKVLKDYLQGEATFLVGQDQAEKIISNMQVDQSYWVGSAICNPKVGTDDSSIVSPSQLKTGQRDPDENGKYIIIEYTHRAEPDPSVNEDFRNHPVLINRPVATDSPEHKAILEEMDSIVKTFELK